MPLSPGFLRYWGKASGDNFHACHLLPFHQLDVAACGNALLRRSKLLQDLAALLSLGETEFLEWVCFWLALHDVGKFSDGFQNLRPDLLQNMQERTTQATYVERHDALGYRLCCGQGREIGLVARLLADAIHPPGTVRDLLQPIIAAVTGHHGKPPILTLNPMPLRHQFPPSVQDDVQEYVTRVKGLFPAGRLVSFGSHDLGETLEDLCRVSWLIAGLAVAADWIGSNDAWFPFLPEPMPLEEYWQKRALPQSERAVKESGVLAIPVSKPRGMRYLYPQVARPTPLQALAEGISFGEVPQLLVIEEVTGGGKTEAAITLAHRIMSAGGADGLYLAMPTMATANAMHRRVRDVYRKLFEVGVTPQLVLAHSASRMALSLEAHIHPDSGPTRGEDTASAECSAWLSDSRKKALLAHVGVGTIDQALLAILATRHQSMRLFGLCRKVLVVDEVHACDAYVHRLLCTLLAFHASLGGSAILLSATLPARMRAELAAAFAKGWRGEAPGTESMDYPLVTQVSTEGTRIFPVEARRECSRKVNVLPVLEPRGVEQLILQHLDAGECVCWVRNTVDDALESHREWDSRLGTDRVALFHARFALGDRLRREEEVQACFGPESTPEMRAGRLLIATQVVEQSLDLDFDFLVSDLAPIDLIIQRAGRLRRHSRDRSGGRVVGNDERGPAAMAVVMPEPVFSPGGTWFSAMFPRGRWVYEHHGQLWLTARWLVDHHGFFVPEDARSMIEAVYGEDAAGQIPDGLSKSCLRAEGAAGAMSAQGRLNSLSLDSGYQATATHWQDNATAPTRLGDPMVTLRLAKWEGDCLVPLLGSDPRHAWELSQVSVRRHRIAREAANLAVEAAEDAKASMPDRGKWCVLIALSSRGPDWIGCAENWQGKPVKIRYNEREGLQFPEEGDG